MRRSAQVWVVFVGEGAFHAGIVGLWGAEGDGGENGCADSIFC